MWAKPSSFHRLWEPGPCNFPMTSPPTFRCTIRKHPFGFLSFFVSASSSCTYEMESAVEAEFVKSVLGEASLEEEEEEEGEGGEWEEGDE